MSVEVMCECFRSLADPGRVWRLTLTAASYAFLMEPHWNPTIEDQALARIHRLGQKNEVMTIRFFIRNSFEKARHLVNLPQC